MFVFCAAASVFSQGDWEAKPVSSWDEKDVSTVLTKSDWVQKHKNQWQALGLLQGEVKATVRLRSALPIRLALYRKAQLNAGYDGLSKAEQAEFDKKSAAVFQCPACSRFYIVSVASNVRPWTREQVMEMKKYITLSNDSGTSIEMTEYDYRVDERRQEYEVIFLFSRPATPGEFLDTSTREITFELDFRYETMRGFPVRKASFEVSRIVRDGMVVF